MNPYDILDLPKDATHKDIKRAYRKLSHQHHPDKGGDAAMFRAVQQAYELLSDPERRRRYDETGDTSVPKDKTASTRQSLELELAAAVAEGYAAGTCEPHRVMPIVREQINRLITQLSGAGRHAGDKSDRLRAAAKRIKLKSGERDNVLVNFMLQKAAEFDRETNFAAERVAHNQELLKVLDDYEYERTAAEREAEGAVVSYGGITMRVTSALWEEL